MTIRKIAQIGHPILRELARPVSIEELRGASMQTLIDDMIETMHDATGAGLAAPQVYESVRIAVLHVHNNKRYPYKPNIPLTVLVNPVITPLSTATFMNYEGCLSVPNLRGSVERFTEIRVSALDRDGNPFEREVRGLTAGTYQHEVDHLDATIFVDRVRDPKTFCTWTEFDRYHHEAFAEQARRLVARYGA